MTPTAVPAFLAFWDAKVARYLARIPAGLRAAETTRLVTQRAVIAAMAAGQDLGPYPDGVTPWDIVGSTMTRAARARAVPRALEPA